MQKIKSLFIRDKENPRLVTREVDPDCKWVIDGEGVATVKYDGSACLIHFGKLYRRHNLKEGRPVPKGWLHWSFDPTQGSGHGWLPVTDVPSDDYHREAWANLPKDVVDGTYELVGPKVCGNPYGLDSHQLWRHGKDVLERAPRTYDEFYEFLLGVEGEGVVWHHDDGRMAKLKRRDVGLAWPV